MNLTEQQLREMGYVETKDGYWHKELGLRVHNTGPIKPGTKVTVSPETFFSGKLGLVSDAPKPHALAPTTHPEPSADTKTPKTPEDRLNKTEREFLSKLRSGDYGNMQYIGIQSLTLQLGFDCRYTPDFWTRMQCGDFRLWEVKGFMRDDARVKLYTAARAFPFWTFVLVQKVKGQWRVKLIDQ